ncbi:MAG: TlpA family protein disulfide reductase [Terriglobus roseus]|nr:TlpA family protein disulfide reductase [Terriglobus roseus]
MLLLVALAALGGLLWFRWAQHVVTARMTAPNLKVQRRAAPDMQFQTLDGQTRRLSDEKGKVVFLDLWGTWCVQCVAEMPTVQKLYEHYRGDPTVQMLIVSRLDTPERIRAYAARNGYTLPFYRMRDQDIPPSMQMGQFPSTFILDKEGRIAVEHTGAADWSSPSVARLMDGLKDE